MRDPETHIFKIKHRSSLKVHALPWNRLLESCLFLFRLMRALRLNMSNLTRPMTLGENEKVAKDPHLPKSIGQKRFYRRILPNFQRMNKQQNILNYLLQSQQNIDTKTKVTPSRKIKIKHRLLFIKNINAHKYFLNFC